MLDDLTTVDDLDVSPPVDGKKPIAPSAPQLPPPPRGDTAKAEKYTKQLCELITKNKILVSHTDLKKFDLASLQDHYSMDLGVYEVEVSHSKQPDNGKDFFIMLFNNLKKVQENGATCTNKVILAYINLTEEQFRAFKNAADEQLEIQRKKEEARRFRQAIAPIDQLLVTISNQSEPISITTDQSTPISSQAPQVTPPFTPPTVDQVNNGAWDASPSNTNSVIN